MYVDGEDLPRRSVIDPRNGFAVNLPLGAQAPAEYWTTNEGKLIREQVNEVRQQLNITIDDNIVLRPPSPSAKVSGVEMARQRLRIRDQS